jgi:type VI secretion system secreted protein Hcp
MDTLILDIPKINGESLLEGYKDKIEILSFSHGIAMQITGDVSNTERTSGKPNHQDFTFSKYMDASTPHLNDACNKATGLGTVKFFILRNDGTEMLILMEYEMSNAIISSVSIGGGGGDKPVETLTINYTALKQTYHSQKEEVGKKGKIETSWDLATNKGK